MFKKGYYLLLENFKILKMMSKENGTLFMSPSLFSSQLSNNRPYLMGMAILLVVVYHALCWIYNPIGRFNFGFIGVDIFLLLSGMGLCFSYEKNSVSKFYKNRIKRIFPVYALAVLLKFIIAKTDWSLTDLLCNLLTIGFYTNGGEQRFDWYLESLFTFYLLFPLFYELSKLKHIGLLLLFIGTYLFLSLVPVSWWYACFIGRFPIFLYGIMIVKCNRFYKEVGLFGILLFVPCLMYSSRFLASSLLTIPFVYLLIFIKDYLSSKITSLITVIGKYTLEIYLANVILRWILDDYLQTCSISLRGVFYVSGQIVFSFIVVWVNKCLAKCFR